jgi:prephenate dehydrogenase
LGSRLLAIVGDGLIGRSVRLAELGRRPDASIVSLDRGDDLEQIREAEVVVLATPVDVILELIPRLPDLAGRASLIVDTGSTKGAIVRTAAEAGLRQFVGGHPMAGGTSSGPAAARADLFNGRPWFLVEGSADTGALEQARGLVEGFGAVPVPMSDHGDAHDDLMAAISHLPQLVATALLATVGEAVGADGLRLAGAGLRDTTRLAASSPGMWRGIVLTNREALTPRLRALARELDTIANRLDDPAAVDELFRRAHRWLGDVKPNADGEPSKGNRGAGP